MVKWCMSTSKQTPSEDTLLVNFLCAYSHPSADLQAALHVMVHASSVQEPTEPALLCGLWQS